MGYAWYIGKRFCKSTSVLFDNLFRNAQSFELILLLRKIFRCKQASMGRLVIENDDRDNNNRSWAKWLKSQTVSQFSVPIFETRDFSERLKGKDLRKGSRGRTERAVHWKTISTTVLAWMVFAQLHLPVNSVKSVLGCTIRLVNSRARSRSENFTKQSD